MSYSYIHVLQLQSGEVRQKKTYTKCTTVKLGFLPIIGTLLVLNLGPLYRDHSRDFRCLNLKGIVA